MWIRHNDIYTIMKCLFPYLRVVVVKNIVQITSVNETMFAGVHVHKSRVDFDVHSFLPEKQKSSY